MLEKLEGIERIMYIQWGGSVMSYSSLNEITQRCNSEGIPFWKAVQYSDMEEREVTEQASFQMMQKMWNAMKAAGDSYDKDQKSRSGLVGAWAVR